MLVINDKSHITINMRMECLADKIENRFELKKKEEKILVNHSSLKGKRKAEIKSLRLLNVNSRTPKLVNSIKILTFV